MFFKKKSVNGEPKKKKALWKRILKWSGISFLLLLITIIALPFIFEKQIFEKVKSVINDNLNAKFECADYGLTLISTFPNFTLELNNVSLEGVEEFQGVKLLKSESIVFTIDIYSVLWGDQIDIKKIGLKKTDVNVIVLENGKANYDIAKPDSVKVKNGVDTAESKFDLKIREYYLENSNITYDDRAGDMYARIANLNHSGTGDFTQDLFEFKTTTTADTINFTYGGIPYMKNTKLDSKLDFDMDMKNMKFTFKPDDYVKLNELDLAFNGFLAMPADMDMDINFSAKQTDFANIYSLVPAIYTADYKSIKFGGKTEFKGFVKGKLSESSMPAFNLDLGVQDGSFQYPGLPKSASGIQVKANVNSKGALDMDDIVVDIAKFNCNLGGNSIAAFLHLVTPMSDPGIKAGLDAHFNLATLKDVVPVDKNSALTGEIDTDVKIDGRMSTIEKGDYENFKASGKILAKNITYKDEASKTDVNLKVMEFIFAPTHLELAQFDAQMDQTQIAASGKMNNYLAYLLKGETLKGEFKLNSPLLDFNSLMGETAATENGTTGTTASENGTTATASTESSVLEIPKNIHFVMQSTIGKIIYPNTPGKPNIELTNLFGQISLVEGVLNLDDLKFNTLDASVKMNGSYDSRDVMNPDVKFNFDIANLDIKKAGETYNIIEKLAPIASKCTGKISTKLDFNTKLNNKMEPDYNTMFGKGTLSTKSIYIEGFEPLNKLADKLKIKSLAKQNIENINMSYKFENGRVYVDPYDVVINKYKTSIAGSTGFDQTIEYVMNMAIPRSEFGGAANGVLDEMMTKANSKAGTNITVGDIINVQAKIGGTLTDPKIETDMKEKMTDLKEELKEVVKEKVIEKVEEIKDDAKAKASEEAEKIMKEAEERAAQLRAEAKKAADKVRAEGKAAGEKLITEAGNNPLKAAAAKKGAEKLNKEAEEKAVKLEKEADEKAQKVLDEGREKADKLK